MLDLHIHPVIWGVHPVLLKIGNLYIPSYGVMIVIALFIGMAWYFYEVHSSQIESEDNVIYIAIAALVGGAIGAKILVFVFNINIFSMKSLDVSAFLSGRTIVGGLIGGILAVILTKKYLKIKIKKGNLFAPAIALGLAIGRIGCFLQGCCYGIATSLPWGVNFGDGILRHPTQLYESLFALLMFFYLLYCKKHKPAPGQLFRMFITNYFIFRFLIEYIRVEPKIYMGLSIYQIFSIIVIIYQFRHKLFVLNFYKRTIV
ncbi:MAG: prolipoprotein diacylglyceryl transferase [Candidatus Roizmanbacteria bacterium]